MNQIYTHPGQNQMQAEVILASKGPDQKPIYTIRLRYPRIVHGEVMTHRVFSRNARSSRAVPVKTMLNEVRNTPFVPWHWGKNQGGMQAAEECNELVNPKPFVANAAFDPFELPYDLSREDAWRYAAKHAVQVAEAYMDAGYHKQIPNRLLEPFSWIDTLITTTEWDNFLWLRDHRDAEPHLQDLARLVKVAIDNAKVWDLEPGDWHLPYITGDDITAAIQMTQCGLDETTEVVEAIQTEFLCKISAARCARISYKPFDGDASYGRELERYNSLVTADRVHASPLEHSAQVDTLVDGSFQNTHLSGNFAHGWIQYRKMIPNEVKSSGVL